MLSYIIRSHMTRKAHKPADAKNVYLAALGRFVASFNCLLPLPTFSVVFSESATSCSICADCVARLPTSSVCSSEISIRDFSAVLEYMSASSSWARQGAATHT